MAFPAFSGTYISCEIIGLKIDSTWGDITGGIQTKVFPFGACICKGRLLEIESEKTFAGNATKRSRRKETKIKQKQENEIEQKQQQKRTENKRGREKKQRLEKWLAWHKATLLAPAQSPQHSAS